MKYAGDFYKIASWCVLALVSSAGGCNGNGSAYPLLGEACSSRGFCAAKLVCVSGVCSRPHDPSSPIPDFGTTPNQCVGKDIPGVKVLGMGEMGTDALQFIIRSGSFIKIAAGQFFVPKSGPYQRMMSAETVTYTEGVYYLRAHCMDEEATTPQSHTEFFSCPQDPTTHMQQCQKSCGDDQQCIWTCQKRTFPDASVDKRDGGVAYDRTPPWDIAPPDLKLIE